MRFFRMNFCQARVRLVQAGTVLAAAALVAGCGNNYRQAIIPITGNGPAAQPTSYAVAVSAPSATTPGIATIIDYSGDSIMASAAVGIGPTSFTMDAGGSTGYTLNRDHTLTEFPVSTSLQEKMIQYTTLPPLAQPLNLFSPSAGIWATDLQGDLVDIFIGSPPALLSSVPIAPTPVMVLGSGTTAQRYFTLSQNIAAPTRTGVECNTSPTAQPAGVVTAIDPSSYSSDPPIQVGKCPVFAVESSDGKRLFVLNRGDDTISVINVQNDTLDACSGLVNQAGQPVTCHPTLPLSQAALNAANAPPNCNFTSDPTCSLPADGGLHAAAGPVYAEYNAALNLLVVADYDGGTISIIDVSLDEYGNDSSTFGTTYTVPVGNNPASVTVLYDGTRAYTANQTDQTVTIVNLISHIVEKTLPVSGHPRTVVSTQNSTQGKVYVASPDSDVLTLIRTDQDIVDTTLLLQGNLVDVRVSTQNGKSGNNNNTSRIPGYGQPCNLPGATAAASLTACQALP
jgi:DNA-binding beta-propeller fold protein YncE